MADDVRANLGFDLLCDQFADRKIVAQYRTDRDPANVLLGRRALVHFAVDPNLGPWIVPVVAGPSAALSIEIVRVGVRDGRITMSEPVRIDGQPGYETRIDATSGKDNTPVTIVQWLRFGSQTALRIIGSSPRDQWAKAFPRFRAVRDGIQPRG